MEVRCAWVLGETCVRWTAVGQRTDPCYYMGNILKKVWNRYMNQSIWNSELVRRAGTPWRSTNPSQIKLTLRIPCQAQYLGWESYCIFISNQNHPSLVYKKSRYYVLEYLDTLSMYLIWGNSFSTFILDNNLFSSL